MLVGYWKIPNSFYEGYNCQGIFFKLGIKMVFGTKKKGN